MANVKISNFALVTNGAGSKPDVRNLSAIAGVEGAANAKISGTELVSSVINSNNSGTAVVVPHRVTFYGPTGEDLGGSENFSWDNTTATLSVNNLSGGPLAGRLNFTHEKIEQLNDSGLSIESDASITIQNAPGVLNSFHVPNANTQNDGFQMWYDSGNSKHYITGSAGTDGYIRFSQQNGELEMGDGNVVTLASSSGSDLELKVGSNTDDLRVYLGTSGPSVGDVLAVDSLDGNTGLMKWSTPSGGFQSYTNKAGADVINWDYATDGPNIRVNLGANLENVLTVDNLSEFPNGSHGFVIMNPTNSTNYKMPDEDHGSATGIKSYMSGGNTALGGTDDVVWEWTYDGANFWWQKFVNYVEPIYIDFDQTNLLGYYTPKVFPQAVAGNVSAGAIVENLTASNTIGDLQTSANVTDFEFYPATVTDPAYWSMGGSANAILRGSTISSGVSATASFCGWMQGPYVDQTYGGVLDFFGVQSSAAYDQQIYLSGREFILFSPSTTPAIEWPELINYPSGADLSNEWIFMSFSFQSSTTSTSNDGQLKAAFGCQSSYDAAVTAGGATDWDYDGLGNTIPVDENGLYFYTSNANLDLDEFFYENFYLGNASDLAENNPAHYGEFGIYDGVITNAQVIANWSATRETYGIT